MPRDFKSRPTVNGAQIGLLSEAGAGISGTYSFAPTASIERHRITDSNVLTNSYILGEIRRPVVAEVDDYGWEYDANVVEVGAGYFDIEIEASILSELADDEFRNDNIIVVEDTKNVVLNATFGQLPSNYRTASLIPLVSTTTKRLISIGVYLGWQGNAPLDEAYLTLDTDSSGQPAGAIFATSNTLAKVTGSIAGGPSYHEFLFPSFTKVLDNYWLIVNRSDVASSSRYYLAGTTNVGSSTSDVMRFDTGSGLWSAYGSAQGKISYTATYAIPRTLFVETINYDYSII